MGENGGLFTPDRNGGILPVRHFLAPVKEHNNYYACYLGLWSKTFSWLSVMW